MTLDAAGRATLLKVARDAIGHGLVHAYLPEVDVDDYPPALRIVACTFVTLHAEAQLRGCIGSLRAHRPLVADVARHAHAAAFADARFEPVRHDELDGLHIHVSILSELEPVAFDDDADLLRSLRPGRHGLLIESGAQRATFLPSVWSSFPEGADFLAALKRKAGMPAASADFSAWRYTTDDFEEARP